MSESQSNAQTQKLKLIISTQLLGPMPGNMIQNCQKPTSLMMSLTKKTKPKFIFSLQTLRLAKYFECLNSSRAQSAGELWSCQVV